jgi:hypothetical protein
MRLTRERSQELPERLISDVMSFSNENIFYVSILLFEHQLTKIIIISFFLKICLIKKINMTQYNFPVKLKMNVLLLLSQ